MECIKSARKVNVNGDNAKVAKELGLTTATGRPNKWMTSSDGTLLPAFFISTPSSDGSQFNSKLKGGNASPGEWIEWSGSYEYGKSRGHLVHGGLYLFLRNLGLSSEETSSELLSIHLAFVEKIECFATISDNQFSTIAFEVYDNFFLNSPILHKFINEYEKEKIFTNGGRSKPRPRPNVPSKNMGGTLYAIKHPDTKMPTFSKGKKILENLTGLKCAESHIFANEYIEQFLPIKQVSVTF